jgi:hypothetical protein
MPDGAVFREAVFGFLVNRENNSRSIVLATTLFLPAQRSETTADETIVNSCKDKSRTLVVAESMKVFGICSVSSGSVDKPDRMISFR